MNRGPDLAPELRAQEQAYESAAAAQDESALQHSNTAFHRIINTAAGAPRLLFLLKTIMRFGREGWYPRIEGCAAQSIKSRARIIDAFERNAANAAGRSAQEHVLDSGELLVEDF